MIFLLTFLNLINIFCSIMILTYLYCYSRATNRFSYGTTQICKKNLSSNSIIDLIYQV